VAVDLAGAERTRSRSDSGYKGNQTILILKVKERTRSLYILFSRLLIIQSEFRRLWRYLLRVRNMKECGYRMVIIKGVVLSILV
jgi:hypothetical protein